MSSRPRFTWSNPVPGVFAIHDHSEAKIATCDRKENAEFICGMMNRNIQQYETDREFGHFEQIMMEEWRSH